MDIESFYKQGWCRFKHDPTLEKWVSHALPAARESVLADEFSKWMRCAGTWFVGVNALQNDSTGAVAGGRSLGGVATEFTYPPESSRRGTCHQIWWSAFGCPLRPLEIVPKDPLPAW